jgi:hypothetical protein
MMIFSEGDSKLEEADAEKVLSILCEVYPNYPWATLVRGGVVFIRHLGLGSNWGMVRKYKDITHDATTFKKEIIMAAGEFLERANLHRGRGNGDEIERVEGLPEKWQPVKRGFSDQAV